MTIETEIAALTTATTNLLSAVNVSKATLDQKVTDATAQVTLATAQATAANASYGQTNAINGTATTQAGLAATSAASANTAKDLALTAWAAATYPGETLGALSQSLHVGTVVKAIVYDTSKDSDGGAWRKRCADKSWYTETLGGDRWIGQRATIAAAWAAAGSVVGAVFQASATAGPIILGKYYSANSATTVTEVFRGITREFPAMAGIVAEANRVVIYDLSNGAMWMVVCYGDARLISSARPVTSVAAFNGTLCFTASSITDGKFSNINFISDNGSARHWDASSVNYLNGLVNRNNSTSFITAAGYILVSDRSNDCAITVLDNAPTDPATGLPVPTIAVATAGGVSVIKHDGTVVNSGSTGSTTRIVVLPRSELVWSISGGSQYSGAPLIDIASGFGFTYHPSPTLPITVGGQASALLSPGLSMSAGTGAGLGLLSRNPTAPVKGMVAAINNAYNSGWQVGDSRLATLADTTAETITGSGELVTNGTFDTDTTGWTATISASLTVVSNRLQVTQGAAGSAAVSTVIPLVIGKTYTLTWNQQAGTGSPLLSGWSNPSAGTSIIVNTGGVGDKTATFTATTTTLYLTLTFNGGPDGQTASFDNISVKLAEPDRSVKNSGLIVNGTLTKAAVAAGAGLVAYSGFSAANYLEQPYTSNLDFGTGDFCVMGWVSMSVLGQAQVFFDRSTAGVSATQLSIFWSSGSQVLKAAIGSAALSSTYAFTVNTRALVMLIRRGGVAELWANGTLVGSAAYTGDATQVGAVVKYGINTNSYGPVFTDQTLPAVYGSLALWRISATAPSADQIAQIYRDELPLFQPNAQCTIAGTSTPVTALAYDDATDLLHVGTSWGRTSFKGLARVDSEATTTGSITSLSASQGAVLTGGTSARYYQPAMLLRDELRRKDEAKRAMGKVPVFFDFTATASQTAFVLPKGYTAKALYKQGTLMRETTTGVYWTRSNDGYQETCTLSVGAGLAPGPSGR